VIAMRLSIIAFFKVFSLRDFRWRLPCCLELDKADDLDNLGKLELLGLGESRRLDLRLRLFGDGERLLKGLLLDPRLLWLDLNRDLIDLERELLPGGSCLDAEESELDPDPPLLGGVPPFLLLPRPRGPSLPSFASLLLVGDGLFSFSLFWIWSLAKTSWAKSSKGLDVGALEGWTFVAAQRFSMAQRKVNS
jgi:hypothetical protein